MKMDKVSDGKTKDVNELVRFRLEPTGHDPVVMKLNRLQLRASSGGRMVPIADVTIEAGNAPKAKVLAASNRMEGGVEVRPLGKRVQFLSSKKLGIDQIIDIVKMFCEELERTLSVTASEPDRPNRGSKGFVDRSTVVAITSARSHPRHHHPSTGR